jgi:DNA-binding IclR family transcriptional regulator
VRSAGFETSQDERGRGASLAVPIFSASGSIVAALGCADTAPLTKSTLLSKRLPLLRKAAGGITEMLGRHPELAYSVERGLAP